MSSGNLGSEDDTQVENPRLKSQKWIHISLHQKRIKKQQWFILHAAISVPYLTTVV